MTRVFGSRRQPGAFFFFEHKALNKTRRAESAVETATAVEIDKGGLRQLLPHDSHQLFGKAFAKTALAFPPLPQRQRRLPILEEAIIHKPPNTKFKLLPGAQLSLNDKSRVSREAQARFCEGLG